MNDEFTSCLADSIGKYVQLKVALGRDFATERRVLHKLDDLMTELRADDLSQSEFDSWCGTESHLSPTVRRKHMRIVRNLCLYRQRTRPDGFVPNPDTFPKPLQPIRPYVFTENDVSQLLQACTRLVATPRFPLRQQALHLAIVLLYTTGLRRRELIRLTLQDYDANEHTLLVRESKFHKSRYLPLAGDADKEIQDYLTSRQNLHLVMHGGSPLIYNGNATGLPYSGEGLWLALHNLMKSAGVRTPDGRVPRVHDFRHGFAISSLLRLYRTGVDLQTKLPMLATYMGHVSIISTEYYLSFVQELAAEASERFEARYGDLVQAPHTAKNHV
jgi:integrase/recombinase XerD